MQKQDYQASILLLSMFLSIIVAISFVTLSSKIHTQIWLWSWNMSGISEMSAIQKSLYHQNSSVISDRSVILFEDTTQKILWLQQGESYILAFSGEENFEIQIWVIQWGAVEYSYIQWSDVSSRISGVVNYSVDIPATLDSSTPNWTLTLTNHWWYSQIIIKSGLNFESSKKRYKILTTIWNHSLIKSQWFTQ